MFSPMPPARSGIADYSAALLAELSLIADVSLFDRAPAHFQPADFDIALYQIGNNSDHEFVYEAALRHPGVVVMHEANLHHLIADLTIRKGDWDGYVRECGHDGGAAALAFAARVRALEVGPDYDGLPMMRRVVESARGVIAHSHFVLRRVRDSGFDGPSAVIPHGAWVDLPPASAAYEDSRNSIRHRLGLEDSTPLIGAFGYLKPYKRIAETLRALRRVVRVNPRVRMILGGEPHPDFPVAQIVRTLGLESNVRLLGYTPVEAFSGYIAACDVIVNLRYPTVGETSGSLLRALSAGRPSLVSDVGSFSELPDDVCLKVPVDETEEQLIFEYLNLLTSRGDVARTIGHHARSWVEKECSWRIAARKYADFLARVVHGESEAPMAPERPRVMIAGYDSESRNGAAPAAAEVEIPASVEIDPESLLQWCANPAARDYCEQHLARLAHTLEIIPAGDASQSILEMGSYMQITPALKFQLGYGHVRGCYYGKLGRSDRKFATSANGDQFECLIDHFDAEKDAYPYDDASFDTVVCGELIEHLFSDPMHMMCEVNRILKPGGHFVITTPNIISFRALAAILESYHPGFFTAYIKPNASGETDARHNREYTPGEVQQLLTGSGFEVVRVETGPFRDEPHPEFSWIRLLLERLQLQTHWRGDGIYAVGKKAGLVKERWPGWLYA
jgi:glycosyltransferase involved in cell wall biosynthesis/SAM-dependent methyltransferase